MTKKTTKEILGDKYFKKYTIKQPSSQRAAAAHVIAKTDDANGNKDAVFTGSNVKMFDRHLEHGYNPGEDAEVYEEVEPLDELSRKTLASYVRKAAADMRAREGDRWLHITGNHHEKPTQASIDKKTQAVMRRQAGIGRATRRLAKEETQLDELSRKTLRKYVQKAGDSMYNAGKKSPHGGYRTYGKRWVGINHATAKMSDHPGMKVHSSEIEKERKRQNRRLAREETQLDELSKKTLASYIKKAATNAGSRAYNSGQDSVYGRARDEDAKKASNKQFSKALSRLRGVDRAVDKLTKEETDLQELSKRTLSSYTTRAAYDLADTARHGGTRPGTKQSLKVSKRAYGIATAGQKLAGNRMVVKAQEEVELQEISSKLADRYVEKAYRPRGGSKNTEGHHWLRAREMHKKADAENAGWTGKGDSPSAAPLRKQAKTHERKAKNRGQGIDRALERIYGVSESSQLDELSKATLASYIKKAGGNHIDSVGSLMHSSARLDAIGTKRAGEASGKLFNKAIKRGRGVMKAVDRLTRPETSRKFQITRRPTKEEVELQELSKSTLASYIKKAADTQYDLGDKHAHGVRDRYDLNAPYHRRIKGDGDARRASRKSFKRSVSIDRAVDKLTREETQLDEISRKTLASYIKKASDEGQVNFGTGLLHAKDSAQYYKGHPEQVRSSKASAQHFRKAHNHSTGIKRAVSRLAKEEVDLQEGGLSRALKKKGFRTYDASDYVNTGDSPNGGYSVAGRDVRVGPKLTGGLRRLGGGPRDAEDYGVSKDPRKIKRMMNRAAKLREGNMAEPLDELSKGTLVHYMHKAVGSAAQAGQRFERSRGKGEPMNMHKERLKVKNRQQGVTRAGARLAYTGGKTPRLSQTIQTKESKDD